MADADNVTGRTRSTRPSLGRRPRSRQRFWRWARAGLLILLLAALVSLLSPLQNGANGVLTHFAPAPTPTALPLDAQWGLLEARPVQLPTLAPGAPCPTTPHHMALDHLGAGNGPVYAVWDPEGRPDGELPYFDAQQYADRFTGGQSNGWGGTQAIWVVDARYLDAVLIRSRQLDGDYLIEFNGGLAQPFDHSNVAADPLLDELHLAGSAFPPPELPYNLWLGYTRLQAPGCYAYQVDGLTFHDTIVFQAVVSQ
jgi:hypothetical protein